MKTISEEQSQCSSRSHCDASSASSTPMQPEPVPRDEEEYEDQVRPLPTRPRGRYLHDDDSSSDGADKPDLMTDESIQLAKFEQEVLARGNVSCGSSTSSSDNDISALDKWVDEIHKSANSLGTAPHDNRSRASQKRMNDSSIQNVDWGQSSYHTDLDHHQRGKPHAGNNGVNHQHQQQNMANNSGAIYFEDTWKNEYTEADYVCFGCIRREWSSSNPALAGLIICIQILIVIIFVMMFHPKNNEHGVTNTTASISINGHNDSSGNVSIMTVVPTPNPLDEITVITLPPIAPDGDTTTAAPATTTTTSPPTLATPTNPPATSPPAVVSDPGSPTIAPNGDGMPSFLEWLPPETQAAITSELMSAQARAFDFMLQDPNWSSYTKKRVLQRFSLATLYFATQGDNWKQNTGWLSYDVHECDWQHTSTGSSLALYVSTAIAVCSTSSTDNGRSYQSLQLANNGLVGTVPPEIQFLTDLQVLDVSQNYNSLGGSLPDAIIEQCNQLQYLVVFENQLTGTIPTSIVALTNFQSFHAWDNQFTGPAFVFGTDDLFQRATNLREWHVGNNQLTGTFPSRTGPSLRQTQSSSSLESLWLYGNQISGSIPSDLAEWAGGLTSFLAWGNKLTGTLPTQLGLLVRVEQLDLEENSLEGAIPSELGLLTTSLKSLFLSYNNLAGPIPNELSQLVGLNTLSLHHNNLAGSILPSVALLTSLYELALQANDFTGSIPSELGILMRTLRDLKLGNNRLSGPIPSEIGRLFNLQRIQFQNNQLTGAIPSQIGTLGSLQECSLQNNQLRSSLPTELGSMTQLTGLLLNQNSFGGSIPPELGLLSNKLKVLDLSSNQLSGNIPNSLYSFSGGSSRSLEELILENNNLSGPISAEIGALNRLVTLELGQNQLTSFVPSEIGTLSALRSLKLNSNQLMWTIPTELGQQSKLQTLDLSSNNLAGSVPSEVGILQQLKSLHLNNNPFLFGPIPARALAALTELEELTLNGTELTGTLPDEVCLLSLLEVDCATDANSRTGLCGCDCACSI